MRSARQSVGKLPEVVTDEIDVRRRITLRIGQRVGKQNATDLGAGFAGDLPHQSWIGDIFQKHRRSLLLPGCADDGGDVLGGRLGFRRYTLRRSEMDAIGVLEISEG